MAVKMDAILGELREEDTSVDGGNETVVSGSIIYTVNGENADENGNFSITAESLGASETEHLHEIGDVNGLQTALNGKSDSNHTHMLVSGINVNGTTVSSSVTLDAGNSVLISKAGQKLTITAEPYEFGSESALPDANEANSLPLKVFSGTRAEWDAFEKSSEAKYIVFLHE